MCRLFKGKEKSPGDWLAKESITWYETAGAVEINLSGLLPGLSKPPKVWIPPIPGTGSMLPNFNHEHNNILVAGVDKDDHARLIDHLQVGDIAVYRIIYSPDGDPANFSYAHRFYAIHRIVKIDRDEQGRYFRFKGDNNTSKDPYKVRDKNILWVSIGTIF